MALYPELFTKANSVTQIGNVNDTGDQASNLLARFSCSRKQLEPVIVNTDSVLKNTDQFSRNKFYSSSFINEICELDRYFASKPTLNGTGNLKCQSVQSQRDRCKILGSSATSSTDESSTSSNVSGSVATDNSIFCTAVFKVEKAKEAINKSLRTPNIDQIKSIHKSEKCLLQNHNSKILGEANSPFYSNWSNYESRELAHKIKAVNSSENISKTIVGPTDRKMKCKSSPSASKRRNTISSISLNKLSLALVLNANKTANTVEKESDKSSNCIFENISDADLEGLKANLMKNIAAVNNLDSHGFTALDMALMLNHVPIIRVLLNNCAIENPNFRTAEDRYYAICTSLDKFNNELRVMLNNLDAAILNNEQIHDYDNRIKKLNSKMKLFQRMKKNFESIDRPAVPMNVVITVNGPNSLNVSFEPPLINNGAYITKYLIEWSTQAHFDVISGQACISSQSGKTTHCIQDLIYNQAYYVRVCCANIRGFSEFAFSTPESLVPSFWRNGISCKEKHQFQTTLLSELDLQIRDSTDFLMPSDLNNMQKVRPRKSSTMDLKKNIKTLFTLAMQPSGYNVAYNESTDNNKENYYNFITKGNSNSKFVKQIKKGYLYLVMIIYDNDRVYTTSDDILPMLEIDDNCNPSTINLDLQFLIKLSFNWPLTKSFKDLVERTIRANSLRIKFHLLAAVLQMQSLLDTDELGRVYYQTISHQASGSSFFVICKQANKDHVYTSLKAQNVQKLLLKSGSSRSHNGFSPIPKLQLEHTYLLRNLNVLIEQDRSCKTRLGKGLYVAFLQVHSSIDVVEVQVSNQISNMLPCTKLRDNSSVSYEEWMALKDLMNQVQPQSDSTDFLLSLLRSITELCTHMKIPEVEDLRIVTTELVELNADVTLILVCPPAETLCPMSYSTNSETKNSVATYIPISIFEANSLEAYNPMFIREYVKVSIKLEIEHLASCQYQREAFSKEEVCNSKRFITCVNKYQMRLEEIWKNSRWIVDHISDLRDKENKTNTLRVSTLVNWAKTSSDDRKSYNNTVKTTDKLNISTCLKCSHKSNIYNRITAFQQNCHCITQAKEPFISHPSLTVKKLENINDNFSSTLENTVFTNIKSNNCIHYNLETRPADSNISLCHLKPIEPQFNSLKVPKKLSPPSLPIDHLFYPSLAAKIPYTLVVYVDAKLLPTEFVYFEVDQSKSQNVHVAELVQILLTRLNEFIAYLNKTKVGEIDSHLCRQEQFVQLRTTANILNTTSCHILYKLVDLTSHTYVLANAKSNGTEEVIDDTMLVVNIGKNVSIGKVFLKQKAFIF